MRSRNSALWVLAAGLSGGTLSFAGGSDAPGVSPTASSQNPASRPVIANKSSVPIYNAPVPVYKPPMLAYQPPLRGAPFIRVDGGSRAEKGEIPTLCVLAPDHVGLTTQEQPSLFWFLSKPVKTQFELTIVEHKKASPVLVVKLPESTQPGIQRLRLSDHQIKLAVGVEYRCTVALVLDEKSRSRDIVTTGVIRRIEPTAALKTRLAGAHDAQLAFIYAEEGIWYDALESLANLIEAQPDNPSFYHQRAALLSQVGLKDAATYEDKLVASREKPEQAQAKTTQD